MLIYLAPSPLSKVTTYMENYCSSGQAEGSQSDGDIDESKQNNALWQIYALFAKFAFTSTRQNNIIIHSTISSSQSTVRVLRTEQSL